MLQDLNVKYIPGQSSQWTGRKSNPALGNQYWYQAIQIGDIENFTNENFIIENSSIESSKTKTSATEKISTEKNTIGLIGYQCDEGVRRNFGRVGAAKGPGMVKEKLAKIPLHNEDKQLVDFGEVVCEKEDMESCQLAFSKIITHLLKYHIFPIGIGGGHDIAYGHFMGIKEALKDKPQKKIGIINFDAHFDLRPLESEPNSGTPFNQILSSESVDYFVIGIQHQSNTKELFEIAQKHKVGYVNSMDCETNDRDLKNIQDQLATFINNNDYLYISIDMDGFSSAYAPGVSAPSPLGFSPNFVFKMLQFIFASEKVISCDIAELNPTMDQDNITANLAAKLVDFIASIQNK